MNEKWTIGIDVAGNGICFQIQNRDGFKLAEGAAAKSMDGYRAFEQTCLSHGVNWNQALVVIEATGRHHLPWCERLLESGAHVFALNPLLTKRLYSSGNAIRDNKDDRLDADTLAEIGRLHGHGLERFAYAPQSERLALQSLVSARKAIRQQCTNLLKNAGDMLALVFPECAQLKLSLKHLGFRRLLMRAPTPERLAALPEDELIRVLGKDKAPKLRQLAINSFTPAALAEACSNALCSLIETIEELASRLREIEHQIEHQLKHRCDPKTKKIETMLRSIPGIGELTAPMLAAFLPEDCTCWGTKKKIAAKLLAYFGCDPRRRESGTFKGKVKISKRGIEAVRTALYQASFCSIKCDPEMRAYYDKKKAEGKHHKQAVIDLIRKTIRRIVAVLVDQKEFVKVA